MPSRRKGKGAKKASTRSSMPAAIRKSIENYSPTSVADTSTSLRRALVLALTDEGVKELREAACAKGSSFVELIRKGSAQCALGCIEGPERFQEARESFDQARSKAKTDDDRGLAANNLALAFSWHAFWLQEVEEAGDEEWDSLIRRNLELLQEAQELQGPGSQGYWQTRFNIAVNRRWRGRRLMDREDAVAASFIFGDIRQAAHTEPALREAFPNIDNEVLRAFDVVRLFGALDTNAEVVRRLSRTIDEAQVPGEDDTSTTPPNVHEDFADVSAADLANRFRPTASAIKRAANLIRAAQNEQPSGRKKFVDDIKELLGRDRYIVLLPSKLRVVLCVGGSADTVQWNRAPKGESKSLAAHRFGIMTPDGLVEPDSQVCPIRAPGRTLG